MTSMGISDEGCSVNHPKYWVIDADNGRSRYLPRKLSIFLKALTVELERPAVLRDGPHHVLWRASG